MPSAGERARQTRRVLAAKHCISSFTGSELALHDTAAEDTRTPAVRRYPGKRRVMTPASSDDDNVFGADTATEAAAAAAV